MAYKIVLISDDSDFFEYIKSKLELRKSDELFTFRFDEIPEKSHLLDSSLLIINSENAEDKTLDLLKIFTWTPIIVCAYNDNEVFRRRCFRAGMFDFMNLLTPDAEFRARLIPALSICNLIEKNKQYKEILINNKFLNKDNDIYIDYNFILDNELKNIYNNVKKAVFVALSPNDKKKFFIKPQLFEAVILNNIRKNDIVMNYAINKYFLILFDTNIDNAKKIIDKISEQLPEKIYAGICNISNQIRQQLINEALNKLHLEINKDANNFKESQNDLNSVIKQDSQYLNFKMFRQEFLKKIEKVVVPVFYQIQQKYLNQIYNTTLEQSVGDGYGVFYVKNKNVISCFKITSPGFAKINIDITYHKDYCLVDSKRIVIDPEEFEYGLLEDLLEQFILEYKRGNDNDFK